MEVTLRYTLLTLLTLFTLCILFKLLYTACMPVYIVILLGEARTLLNELIYL